MANCGKDILLTREGSEQIQRFLKALDPDSINLNDFSLKEWMQFAYNFAKHVNYYNTNNSEVLSGNWEDFFKKDSEIEDYLKEVKKGGSIEPHLALFISFIKLLEYTQKRFNRLNKRHLDFCYKKILKIEKEPANLDKVHAIFELAKSISTSKIEKGTELDGGKDKNGKKLIYKTTDELIVNKAKVAQLKSVYNDSDKRVLKVASVANSLDGTGTSFTGEARWWPFGYFEDPPEEDEVDTREYTELEDAIVGFSIAANILKLKEGERNVLLTIHFDQDLPTSFNIDPFYECFEIQCSGEKGWIEKIRFKKDIGKGEIFKSELIEESKTLKLAFQIPQDEKAVIGYDKKIHGEGYNTTDPVCRFIIKIKDNTSYDLFQILSSAVFSNIQIDVKVTNVKSLILQNDTGTIDAKKPFFPFGTQPIKKSRFTVDYREMFDKNWKDFELDIKWKDTPDKFDEHYKTYRDRFYKPITPEEYIDEVGKTSKTHDLVQSEEYFTATAELNYPEKWETVNVFRIEGDNETEMSTVRLFYGDAGAYETNFKVKANQTKRSRGAFSLRLDKTFGHELFPRMYTLALSSKLVKAVVPNEPYTPLIDSITLDYSASVNITNVFHEHPFGHSSKLEHEKINKFTILPKDYIGGNLFIGLEDAQAGQIVSLLVQVLEGSENPETESFSEDDKVEWSVLCDSQWKKLDSNYMISNGIDNFLRSGIVKFSIPKEASTKNTILPTKYIWIKANMNKNYNAVCKTIGINAQAVMAQLVNNSNDLSHLKNGIKAKTISKLVKKVSGIKSISQPYNSFDGLRQESDIEYYRRVSERLRHKNRAISIWDYEHLILQEFPEVYKVKCLNHSKIEYKNNETIRSYLSPGNVTLVVIPDVVNKNVFDIYQPRLSTATLNAIGSFINPLNTFHVNALVINPEYEEVTVSLIAKFYKGYDENYYTKVLEKDITKLLSPWAFETTAKIRFGISLHRSMVTSYIEKLEYVDYVKKVELIKNGIRSTTYVKPSNPETILVSAKEHKIN